MLERLEIGGATINLDIPDICPNCGKGIVTKLLSCKQATATAEIGIIFECPACNFKTGKYFVGGRQKQ